MTPRVLTANRLGDGVPVYWGATGAWVERLADAALATDDEGAEALRAEGAEAVARRQVVGPYLMEVALERGVPAPRSQRERIRAAGPSVAFGEIRD